jgi:hypothetical protein
VRQFRDAAGVEWKVSMTARSSPAVSRDHYLPEAYREGWLLFESADEKRRLAPVPSDWESLPDEKLAELCSSASPQPSRPRERADASPSPALTPREELLRPKLHDVERQLNQTLDEVCDAPPAEKLDTGELIRVEETLALATEAAKEAVSLRRRMRMDRERQTDRSTETSVPDRKHDNASEQSPPHEPK